MKRTILHIAGGEGRSRAELARLAIALGHDVEIYPDLDELVERCPRDGVIIAADEGRADAASRLIARLGAYGVCLPVVVAAHDPDIDRVVTAIKSGALDYLQLPLELGAFARRLTGILGEAGQYVARRRREIEAQRDLALLSHRERQVLELLTAGCANKEMARRLEISPRTVEIHRGNMMAKLNAGHPADAVRLWLDSQQTVAPAFDPADESPFRAPDIAGRVDDRWPVPLGPDRRRAQRQ